MDLTLAPRSVLSVTVHLAQGQASNALTSHPGSRTTSYLAHGDQTEAAELAGATPVDHWYLLSAVEVRAGWSTAALAVLGDSLTDGRGSTANRNNRWPDRLLDRLQPRLPGLALANQAAGGNRVLNDGPGPAALARLDRDVLPAYDVGDPLHLNPAGYKALAEAVPAGLLRRTGGRDGLSAVLRGPDG
ncbi:SGNH/GDSL hydrolase family protein [Nonomuraea sp. NPDC049758]|uniref:SGNH/GDSL hydrolase family protein n=1 Tax=Nonomuraea sp. NPDC049758 TaxID=3154360 RepID=UPI00341E94C3